MIDLDCEIFLLILDSSMLACCGQYTCWLQQANNYFVSLISFKKLFVCAVCSLFETFPFVIYLFETFKNWKNFLNRMTIQIEKVSNPYPKLFIFEIVFVTFSIQEERKKNSDISTCCPM